MCHICFPLRSVLYYPGIKLNHQKKWPFSTLLKKLNQKKQSWICTWMWFFTTITLGLSLGHVASFQRVLFKIDTSDSFMIWLTDGRTNKPTDTVENMTSREEVINCVWDKAVFSWLLCLFEHSGLFLSQWNVLAFTQLSNKYINAAWRAHQNNLWQSK